MTADKGEMMIRVHGAAILSLMLSGAAAMAAVPPAKSVAPAAKASTQTPLPLTPGVRRAAMSPQGIEIAKRMLENPDPRLAQIQAEMAALLQEKAQFVSGAPVDVDKLEPVLRREEALVSEFKKRQNDRLLGLLRALPDADRIAFLQSRAVPAKPQNSPAPAPAPSR